MKKTVVATAPVALTRSGGREGNSLLGNIVTDAMLAYGSKSGAQIAIMNNGGIRADIDAGPITFDEVIQTSPFGNTLVIVDLTGAELLAAFEHGAEKLSGDDSGLMLHVSHGTHIRYDAAQPAGKRVVEATVGGTKIDPAKTYRIVTNSFVASGGDAFTSIRDAKGYRLDTGTLDRDVLVEFLKSYKGEDLTRDKRIEIGR
jgi:5'-nucleotidase